MKSKLAKSSNREDVSKVLAPIEKFIPEDRYDQFVDQVHSAIEIYLDLDEPSVVSKELREIDKICRNPNYTLLNVIKNVSANTREILDEKTPLPDLPDKDDDAAIDALAKKIRQRIVVRMKLLCDRIGYRLIGHSKVGRPSKQRLSVLVSFVAAAYVGATEKGYRRRWDGDEDLPFHQILEKLFCALDINASADEAIRRQQISPY